MLKEFLVKEIKVGEKTITYGVLDNKVYLNTTPHSINFSKEGEEKVIVLPASSLLINAKPTEEVVKEESGITYVKTSFTGDAAQLEDLNAIIDSIKTIENIEAVLIVGSIIAAQAFAGTILALTPVKGFERVPPAEKRMNLDKFTIF